MSRFRVILFASIILLKSSLVLADDLPKLDEKTQTWFNQQVEKFQSGHFANGISDPVNGDWQAPIDNRPGTYTAYAHTKPDGTRIIEYSAKPLGDTETHQTFVTNRSSGGTTLNPSPKTLSGLSVGLSVDEPKAEVSKSIPPIAKVAPEQIIAKPRVLVSYENKK